MKPPLNEGEFHNRMVIETEEDGEIIISIEPLYDEAKGGIESEANNCVVIVSHPNHLETLDQVKDIAKKIWKFAEEHGAFSGRTDSEKNNGMKESYIWLKASSHRGDYSYDDDEYRENSQQKTNLRGVEELIYSWDH